MSTTQKTGQTTLVAGLILVALVALVMMYNSPIWWVSLTAPNYPEEAFPDGVRIQFHMNGVFNGCSKVNKAEIQEDIALDCVHEMDTINHYVGMYPIAAGGPVERGFSQFLVAFLAVMLIGFIVKNSNQRTWVLSAGFAAVAIWMSVTFFTSNGLKWQNTGYIHAMVSSLDQDAGQKEGQEVVIDIGSSWVKSKKTELAASGIEVVLPSEQDKPAAAANVELSEKESLLNSLQKTFEHGGMSGEQNVWNGSALQLMVWHYEKSLGRYFNNPAEIRPMVKIMSAAIYLLFAAIIAAMVFLVVAGRRYPIFYWALLLIPAALPLFFIIEYSAWLWWFGHNLNDMGAFTVKPFMPTVFGQGKVAQFATHSYPDIGFALMLLISVLLAAAGIIRNKELKSVE
ncbi:MAG: hypothetical protein HQL49_01695 [Gammaproteobacteria bacterium]|nr:hypothetical protein [Gammaproteobacteria bacterium]